MNGFGNFKYGIKEGIERTILPIVNGRSTYFFQDWQFLLFIVIILIIHSIIIEKNISKEILSRIPLVFKYIFLAIFLLLILYFGNYGPLTVDKNFIYFNF